MNVPLTLASNKSKTESSFIKLHDVLLPIKVPILKTLPPFKNIVTLAGAVKVPPDKSISVCISQTLLAFSISGLVKSVDNVGINTLGFVVPLVFSLVTTSEDNLDSVISDMNLIGIAIIRIILMIILIV